MLHARCFKGVMDKKRRRLKGKQPVPADDDDDLQVLNVTLCAMFLMRAYSYGLHPKRVEINALDGCSHRAVQYSLGTPEQVCI